MTRLWSSDPRSLLSRQLSLIPLVAASLTLLASCESGTAPAARISVNAVTAQRERSVDEADPGATVVVGTGDPSVDVAAVQAAVDRGGAVLLKGHFSFDLAPTNVIASSLSAQPPGLGYAPAAEVVVTKAVTISGTGQPHGEATIDGGTIPFYVNAPGQQVTIQRIRFVKPTSSAILVYAAHDVEIASTTIAGAVPFRNLADAIGINTSGPPPTLAAAGHPENVSGTLKIVRNDIDMSGGTSLDNTLGIVVFAVGTTAAMVDAHVDGNKVRNTTEPAINFRTIAGRANVTHNVIATGAIVGGAPRNQVIRIATSGAYRVTDNVIDCAWPNPEAEAIGVFSNIASLPIAHAVVENNQITMSPPATMVLTAFSAGIGVYGYAHDNVVRHNTLRGRARAGLSIPVFPLSPQTPATPQNNAFVDNRFVDFTPAVADIYVGAHAIGTRIVGPGSVDDEGDGTIVVQDGAPRSLVRDFSADVPVAYYNLSLQFTKRTAGFTPPVQARAYGYMGIALYEALVDGMPDHRSMVRQLNGVGPLPDAEGLPYSWPLVANAALAEVMRGLWGDQTNFAAANIADLNALEAQLASEYSANVPPGLAKLSSDFGHEMGAAVFATSRDDGGDLGYLTNFPTSYSPPTGPGLWVPTAAGQLAMQPYWGTTVGTLALTNAMQCDPGPPPAYSEQTGSAFYDEANLDYRISKMLTSEQTTIARYWADGPGTISGPGHSLAIVTEVVLQQHANLATAAEAYARAGIADADAVTALWWVKYHYNLIRPVTYINRVIDPTWAPLLPTPPFPEYVSAHSGQSAAVMATLEDLFGDNVPFVDHAHDADGFAPRSFPRIFAAAEEAGMSRLYAGIHFSSGNLKGQSLGRCVAARVNSLNWKGKLALSPASPRPRGW